MPAVREPGRMDNPYYDWSPLSTRPQLRWPNDARVALCVIVCVEEIEWLPPEHAVVPPSAVRFGPYPRVIDVHEISHHEYGNRVGIFRVMETLDSHGIIATTAIDAFSVAGKPFIVEQCKKRGWEFIGHGISFGRMITEGMSELEEREYIRRSLCAIRSATGVDARGWLGPDYGESTRTVRLLAEMGVRYVCDWANDEQPYRMKTPTNEVVSLPVTLDFDEIHTLRERGVSTQRWLRIVVESVDRLHHDGLASGRVAVLVLHPYIIGQPHRIRYLDQALRHILSLKGVWAATGSEIVDSYLGATSP